MQRSQETTPTYTVDELFNNIDVGDMKTWPRNKDLAVAFYDLWWDNPDHEKSDYWQSQYESHWNLYLKGEDLYVPF